MKGKVSTIECNRNLITLLEEVSRLSSLDTKDEFVGVSVIIACLEVFISQAGQCYKNQRLLGASEVIKEKVENLKELTKPREDQTLEKSKLPDIKIVCDNLSDLADSSKNIEKTYVEYSGDVSTLLDQVINSKSENKEEFVKRVICFTALKSLTVHVEHSKNCYELQKEAIQERLEELKKSIKQTPTTTLTPEIINYYADYNVNYK